MMAAFVEVQRFDGGEGPGARPIISRHVPEPIPRVAGHVQMNIQAIYKLSTNPEPLEGICKPMELLHEIRGSQSRFVLQFG
jgi:hypothetical protein